MQVNVPSLQPRSDHGVAAFSLNSGLSEVAIILFGGCPEVPSTIKTFDDIPKMANTTVLRFGESTPSMCAVCP